MSSAVDQPEEQAEKHYSAEHDDAVVHTFCTRIHRRRPHGEERADK